MLENNIKALLEHKKPLIMAHLVLGFPSFEENRKVVDEMVNAGVEVIELQIPFSESWDGPVILKANEEALKNGTTVSACFDFAQKIVKAYPDTIFLFMTYYNVLFAQGVEAFAKKAKAIGIQGTIVPDIPPEEGKEYIAACESAGISPIFLFTPTTPDERLKELCAYSKGIAYCVGRKGTTGIKTNADDSLIELIERYRRSIDLPIALGFGIQSKQDFDAIAPYIDIAVIGTKLLIVQQESGANGVGLFLKSLRQ
ncbi:MAG: tryptophan synthase subunit alpha [Alphaproteobacteria bacterium]|nr:tryptophan synthase subunit alpha [Alphaproteobacteria bacterium]